MASNLSKRLDKLEKGIAQLTAARDTTPAYVAEGEPVPEGATVIIMQWVEAQHQEDTQLEAGPSLDGAGQSLDAQNSTLRKTPSTLPPSEPAAEREKRWRKHLQALEMRGERYRGEPPPREF